MYDKPVQPLSDLETLRVENEHLKSLLNYALTCLTNSAWASNADKNYVDVLVEHVRRHINDKQQGTQDDLFLEPDPTLD